MDEKKEPVIDYKNNEDDDEDSLINYVLETIYKKNALLLPPVEDHLEFDACNFDLFDVGSPPLPMEYTIDFLMETNGLSWESVEFFGTYDVKDKSTGYTVLNSIVYENFEVRKREAFPKHFLLIGSEDEFNFIYDFKTQKYKIIDRLTLIEAEEFDSFEELIKDTFRDICNGYK